MRRAARVALLVALALLAPAAVAGAHGGNPDFRSVIDSVTPPVPDVEFEVLDYDSHMQLLDQHGHVVVIYGYEGEPYARILGDGTVQVNRRSPATYLNDDRFAEVTVPALADAKAKPEWETVDDSGTFLWHDHRMHYMAPGVPPQVTDKGRKTRIFDYEIPIRVDGTAGAVAGTLYWVGSPTASKLPFALIGAAILVGGVLLTLFVRRRRREEDGDGGDPPAAAEPQREAW